MTNKEYLEEIVEELKEDTEWEFPKELRVVLEDLEWGLLGL